MTGVQTCALPIYDKLSPDGRVMEVLSEHQCQGWLEGYLLTGRHGLMSSYEAFIHIVDSMFNQHAKWLTICNHLSWRAKVPSINLLITSTVWRQDHNGFTHQDPGFLDVVVNKSAAVTRIYLPPDANSLLCVADHCLRSENYINVIVSDKQNHLQYLSMEEAITHCTKGLSIWAQASTDRGGEPDVVLACAGDIPTKETLAAVQILRRQILFRIRRRIRRLLAHRKIRLLGHSTSTKRSIPVAQPTTHKQIVRRRTRPGNPRDRDVTRQTTATTLQITHNRTNVRLTE